MKLTVLVNDARQIEVKQTTLRIIGVALRRGHTVVVADPLDLSRRTDGSVHVHGRGLPDHAASSDKGLLDWIRDCPRQARVLDQDDVLLLRTNPGRDSGRSELHTAVLQMAAAAESRGTAVLNTPTGLRAASNKLLLLSLPESVRPRTLVSPDRAEIRAFIDSFDGPAVIKPTCGSRGLDVFYVNSADDKNLNQILDVMLRRGLPMVQEFVHGPPGDTRVLVLDGALFEVDGKPGAFRRIPAAGDFRSNLDVGGRTDRANITPAVRKAVELAAPVLRDMGLYFTGLDFIEDRIIEVNGFSPGGLRAAARHEGAAFDDAFMDWLESRATTAPAP